MSDKTSPTVTPPKRNILRPIIIGCVVLVAGYFGYQKIHFALTNEDTENSQFEAAIVPVGAKVGGYVTSVRVKDNQVVKAGDTLATMDDRDLQLRVLQAEVAVKNAEANVGVIQANAGSVAANVGTSEANTEAFNAGLVSASSAIATANANVEAARVRVWKATQDFNRYSQLLADKAITPQQFDAAKAEKETAEATFTVAQRQAESANKAADVANRQTGIGRKQTQAAQSQVSAAQKQIELARTQVAQRRAELELAKLNLTYTAVVAPISGTVARKNMQVGQLVNAGAPLCQLVDASETWVVANFKETQVGSMKVGDAVKVKVDAYKGKTFTGQIQSFAGATGAKFALIPPDNASGNFVKVVQRVPVKIVMTEANDANFPLRAGMSVEVIVPKK
jgi:membrane fusion protein, multidrug efflux system